jgi:hypothetical protein
MSDRDVHGEAPRLSVVLPTYDQPERLGTWLVWLFARTRTPTQHVIA